MSEGWVFNTEPESPEINTLEEFVEDLCMEYNIRNIRDITRTFLWLAAHVPPNVAVEDIDRYFVGVYTFLARMSPYMCVRLTILREFAENYSYVTRFRARFYWAFETHVWRTLHATYHCESSQLCGEYVASQTRVEGQRAETEWALHLDLFIKERADAAYERWLVAEEDC